MPENTYTCYCDWWVGGPPLPPCSACGAPTTNDCPGADDVIHWRGGHTRMSCVIDRLRAALETIAHDHAQHAQLFSRCQQEGDPVAAVVRGAMSVGLGWAQGIAREAMGDAQSAFTEHFAAVRAAAYPHQHPAPGAGEGSEKG